MEWILKCPKSDGHEYFSAIAHVAQEWAVDKKGNFVEVRDDCTDVLVRPRAGDIFICEECGEEAQTIDGKGNLIRGG